MTERMVALTKKYTMKIWILLLKYTFIVATKHHLVQLLSICLMCLFRKSTKLDLKETKTTPVSCWWNFGMHVAGNRCRPLQLF